VVVQLNTQVTDYVDDTVFFTGKTIQTKNLIWAAGVSAMVFDGIPAESYGRGRRMATDDFNKVNGPENIYAIGAILVSNSPMPIFLADIPSGASRHSARD
jgi:NADH dehydrogenase